MQLTRLRSFATDTLAHRRGEAGGVRGTCPGSFTPMASGDGWLLRLRTGARAVDVRTLRQLVQLAQAYGNGIIELTRRANLQLRGLQNESIAELRSQLIALGLVDASPALEARPALLVDPLAAIDPDSDARELAGLVDAALVGFAADGGKLSAKFGVVLDAGSVRQVDADIRVVARRAASRVQVYVDAGGVEQLLIECPRAAAGIVVRKLLDELVSCSPCAAVGGTRMRDLFAHRELAALRAGMLDSLAASASVSRAVGAQTGAVIEHEELSASRAAALAESRVPAASASVKRAGGARRLELRRRGAVTTEPCVNVAEGVAESPPTAAVGSHAGWFGVGVPYGCGSHGQWLAIADLSERYGDGAVRFSAAREVLITGVRSERVVELADAARAAGLIVDASDVRRRIVACSGAPACESAYGETRALASRLAEQAAPLLAAGASLHVSGCEKGCASRAFAELNVVLAPDGHARLALDADIRAATAAAAEPLEVVSKRLAELSMRVRSK